MIDEFKRKARINSHPPWYEMQFQAVYTNRGGSEGLVSNEP